MEEKIKVFVTINENNEIVEIGSNVFINDLTNSNAPDPSVNT